jgi:ABC-type multidrug transport system fused ATPase/permease subunit
MRYRPGLDWVLRGLSCDIKPGLKVAVVGRTGAGKSSLMLALLRLYKYKGAVMLDGMDTTGMVGERHTTRLPQGTHAADPPAQG